MESEKWYNILKRIIDVVLFLGECGLAFKGFSQHVGDLTLSLPRSSIDDLVFSVFTSNFFKLSYKLVY